MSFQDEMKQMFLRVTAGEVEPEEWEKWWNSSPVKIFGYYEERFGITHSAYWLFQGWQI